jgi:hypothetical protein
VEHVARQHGVEGGETGSVSPPSTPCWRATCSTAPPATSSPRSRRRWRPALRVTARSAATLTRPTALNERCQPATSSRRPTGSIGSEDEFAAETASSLATLLVAGGVHVSIILDSEAGGGLRPGRGLGEQQQVVAVAGDRPVGRDLDEALLAGHPPGRGRGPRLDHPRFRGVAARIGARDPRHPSAGAGPRRAAAGRCRCG